MLTTAVDHLVKRGVQHLATRMTEEQQYIGRLEQDAQLYENAGPDMEIKPWELVPMLVTGLVTLLVISTINYAVGQVIASLAMIESPSHTTIIEAKTAPPPPYSDDEPDAPLEKKTPLPEEEALIDVELTVLEQTVPVTNKLRTAARHLRNIGGFRAFWRGVRLSIFYNLVHGSAINLIVSYLEAGILGQAFIYVFVSVMTARLHMAWTHSMIAHPSQKSWYSRMPSFKDSRVVFLPALVYALAKQATILLPVAVAFATGLAQTEVAMDMPMPQTAYEMAGFVLRLVAAPLTYVVVALTVQLPAAITLKRVEAVCLAEGEEAIVAFDREVLVGDVDLHSNKGPRVLFKQVWKSVDRARRMRVLKIFAKMALISFVVFLTGVHLVLAEVMLLGTDRLSIFAKSASAQLQLMAIQAQRPQ